MIDETAGQKLKAYMTREGLPETSEATEELIKYANALVMKYGEASAALACEMYDAISAAEGANVPPAEPAPLPEYSETAKAINGTLKKSDNLDYISGAVERLVKQRGADTMLRNAKRDNAEWAWIPNGDTCAFCMTLASRGWQPASKAVLQGGHAEHIHANCDCTFAIRHDSSMNVAGYDPDKLREEYDRHHGDINAWRRELQEQNKNKINIQKSALDKNEQNDIIPKMSMVDITDDYRNKAALSEGNITKENGFIEKNHKEEIAFAEWLKESLGGNIIHNIDHNDKHYADYTWNGNLWELKTISSSKYNTIDQHIRDANKQISENRGGIFIDMSNNILSIDQMRDNILQSMVGRHIETTDVLIKKEDDFRIYRNE